MTDIVDKKTRSRMMAGIKGKDTVPELVLRRALHARSFRFRLHPKDVLGRPDLVFPKHQAVVFVHGCFWHRHVGCRFTTTPSTRLDFWQAKFNANIVRDREVKDKLHDAGWRVAIVWGCTLRKPEQIEETANDLTAWLLGGKTTITIG